MTSVDSKSLVAKIETGLKNCDDCDKQIITCVRIKKQDLTPDEIIDSRVFYWSAFNGSNKMMRLMILQRKWSPFIKAFRNRSIVSGAILGGNIETIRYLLTKYKYESAGHVDL